MAVEVGMEILIRGQWVDAESAEARAFLERYETAASVGSQLAANALEDIYATMTRHVVRISSDRVLLTHEGANPPSDPLAMISPAPRQEIEQLTEAVQLFGDGGATREEVADAVRNIAVATEPAAEALRSLGVRLSGLSTVEIDPALVAQPTACARCLYHSSNSLLACAVHPLGRPGEVCGDWEDGATEAAKQWRMDAALTTRNAELEAQEDLTTRNQRVYAAENARLIAEQRQQEAAWVESERRREEVAQVEAESQHEAMAARYQGIAEGWVCRERRADSVVQTTRRYSADGVMIDKVVTNSPAHAPGECDRAGA